MYPSCLSVCWNASTLAAFSVRVLVSSKPIRHTFPPFCASAASGAASAPASDISRKRRRSIPGWWDGRAAKVKGGRVTRLGSVSLLSPASTLSPLATNLTSLARAQRNRERKRRTLPHLTLDPDPSAMQFDELPRQGQAKPGAFDLLGRRPNLFELLEDGVLILRRDTHAGVADRDLHGTI